MFLEMTITSLHLSSSVNIYVLWRHLCSKAPWIYVPSFDRKRKSGPLVRVAHFLTFDSICSTQLQIADLYPTSTLASTGALELPLQWMHMGVQRVDFSSWRAIERGEMKAGKVGRLYHV